MRPGKVAHEPRLAGAQLTEAFANAFRGAPSATAMAIGGVDSAMSLSQACCAVLLAALLEIARAEPSGSIGVSYRRYIRFAHFPAVCRD